MDKWLSHNNIVKIIALVFSIILWAMVHIDSGTTIVTTTPDLKPKAINNVNIQVTGFDTDRYVLYDLNPDKVRLEVKGRKTDLTTNFSNYKVKLNLKDVGPGTFTLPLTTELPPGVQAVSIDPAYVKVTIEEKRTKEIPVSIITKGVPEKGFEVGTPISTLDMVQVTLPESEIDDLQKVQGIVDITGLNDSLKGKSVKLVAYDKQGEVMRNAEISPESVDVDIPFNKTYKNIPLEVRQSGQLPEGYVLAGVDTDVKGVVVYGPKEAMDKITAYPITVNLNNYNGNPETKYTVNLTPPEGFEKIEPSSLQVTIKVEPASQKVIDNIPISLTNLGANLTARFIQPSDKKFSLTVMGTSEQLSGLKAKDITLEADLSKMGAGIHSVPLKVTLPNYVKLVESGTALEIEVELTEKDSHPTTTDPEGPPSNNTDGTDTGPSNGTGDNGAAESNVGNNSESDSGG
ncbi:CdaR family protein [Paenibacillus motobuensis]|uniref:CdaR family protein n=1 Tax=Paenibacillus TaxID=44249 RepID=UPI00203A43AE|nr:MULTISPECIES: CdaR family protein [Paenibacillus]MCM3042100.1 CdaR family protein [Paenibacillus lutimineralis]MCM3649204.1 CdaR family protein [Paenibacillus motobuensis]